MSSVPFASRHLGYAQTVQTQMLEVVGYQSLDELMSAAVPTEIADFTPPELPPAASEAEAAQELASLAALNQPGESLIGLGYYSTLTPAVIRRNVLEDPSWYTAYTPYQPEISQGRLEALLNFQTMVSDLTGLPVANASLLDEATAVAEAMTLIRRAQPKATGAFVMDADALPQTIAVVRTRALALGIEVITAQLSEGLPDLPISGVMIQYPGASGEVRDIAPLIEQVHQRGGMAVVAADLLALTLYAAPGDLGADVVVGTTQRFGVPLFYGGPHAAYIAVGEKLARHLPGRLVGVSVDAAGRTAYRLALQTREQHIRRDRATSNICTAQVLLAVVAGMYAVYHGPEGLREIAERVRCHAHHLAARFRAADWVVETQEVFDTLVVQHERAVELVQIARSGGFHLRLLTDTRFAISVGETFTTSQRTALLGLLGVADEVAEEPLELTPIPDSQQRRSSYLTHEVFHAHRSETAMLRYLRRLSARDYALDRGMIPLGSCTMKLNATTEMEPVSLPGFANLHPFVAPECALGYRQLITSLEHWLAEITGYDRVSVQPNAGSQGELAGLLAIRAYHDANGEPDRKICLIPASAHGTNAASAVMAGMQVVVVKTAEDGSVDMTDLADKCQTHAQTLAAIMVTYPSTFGVYELEISRLCDLVHSYGGQVYVDGANLNALVGHAKPGKFGGDVSHLNLHKTFCIPHGGGGPGVGPVAVRAHLAPYLPSPETQGIEPQTQAIESGAPGPVSAAPFGSAGILPISWAYIRMMGGDGLKLATAQAVLSANYLAAKLDKYFPVLHRGESGLVAHECILDLRQITLDTGVSAEDVAKRLIDYGFHAPTMSFPVAGTLMVEPTESESLAELDRFVTAMVAIAGEIERVRSGEWDVADSPLRNAPHPAADLLTDGQRAYSAVEAAYPSGADPDKYWPPVSRVDQAYGDRNLVCSCPPPEAFEV